MSDLLSSGIFLSYRRHDTAPYARLLQRELKVRFPDARVFMDLDSIEAGLDFAEVIREAVGSCVVLVALIGRQWATLVGEDGSRRIDDPDDYVRFEVQTALDRGVRVIPVLVDGARPLRQQQLPSALQKLARLNALKLSYERYQYDADRLFDLIQRVLDAAASTDTARRASSARDAATPTVPHASNSQISFPSNRADSVEQLPQSTGLDAIDQVLEEHIRKVSDVRASHKLNNADLLSTKIARSPGFPRDLQISATQLHGKIKNIIYQTATSIEDSRYREVEIAVSELPDGPAARERARELVQADKRMHISYESLRLAVGFFRDRNLTLLANIENERSPQRLADMTFGNAILIYELTDFMVDYLDGFSMGDEVDRLHADMQRRVQEIRDRQEKLKAKAQEPNIDPDVRESTLEDIRLRKAVLEELDREWDAYLGEVRRIDEIVTSTQSMIPILEQIRLEAELQLAALQEIGMLRFLKRSSGLVCGTIEMLQGFRIVPLSSTKVRRLLGI